MQGGWTLKPLKSSLPVEASEDSEILELEDLSWHYYYYHCWNHLSSTGGRLLRFGRQLSGT